MTAAQIALLMNPPPGVTVLFAGSDRGYARSMRRIFHSPDGPDEVLVAAKGDQTWAVVPIGLIVLFTSNTGDDSIVVEPLLIGVDPAQYAWPRDFAQPAIDATQALLLRNAPTRGVQ